MHASKHCAEFITGFEGGQSRDGKFHPYFDRIGGLWTIGYGHTEGVTSRTKPLTKKQAEDLLDHDLNHAYAPAVEAQLYAYRIRRYLNQNEFDALVSFAYNLGPGILSPIHTIGEELRAVGKAKTKAGRVQHLDKAADAMLLYDHGANGQHEPGLTRRRKAERTLFLKR
jgi:lysozyme